MKFASIENIWTIDLRTIPNIEIGRVYVERTKRVVADILSNPASIPGAVINGRIVRSVVAARVGCRAAAISRNLCIRQIIKDAERTMSRSSAAGEADVQKLPLRMRVACLERQILELRSICTAQANQIAALEASRRAT
jgi:hypothetical protein